MSYNDPSLTGGRRVYNIGGHGGSFAAHGSLNQRLLDGFDFNESGRRFDNHFDTSHENIGADHNSSRLNYSTGHTENVNNAVKRSETEMIRTTNQVTFAETTSLARNHPMHMKTATGHYLERIDER
jgi:hypothetical protein